MGEYLSCGIAKRIVIRSENEEENKDAILERIGKNIDLKLYDRIDNEEYIILNIKKEIFEINVYELVKEQVSNYLIDKFGNAMTEYEIKKLENKKYEELIKLAKSHGIGAFYFKRGNTINNDISYLDPEGKCFIYCDLIEFFQTGESFLECYNGLFTYFRNCIIKSSQNPIRTAMVITLT